MYSLLPALTGQNSNQGIKHMNIFYDTLILTTRSFVSANNTYPETCIIQPISYNFTNYELLAAGNNQIIQFGNSGYANPSYSNGNLFVDNILLEKEKVVLICGLQTASGAFIPIVYRYNINDGLLEEVYDGVKDDWSALNMNNFKINQKPLVSFNPVTKILNYILVTTTTGIESLFDIELLFSDNELTLHNVRKLVMSNLNSNNYTFVDYKNFNDNEKLLLTLLNNKTVVPLKI